METSVTTGLPLALEYVSGGIVSVWSVVFNTCSAFVHVFQAAYNFVHNAVAFTVPKIVTGIVAVVQFMFSLLMMCVSGILTVVFSIWDLIVFLTSSALSITTKIVGIAWNTLSFFYSGSIKSGFESFASESTHVAHGLSVWVANMVLHVLHFALTMVILIILGSCLYIVLRDCWRWFQEHRLAQEEAGQNDIDGNIQHRQVS